MPTPNASGLRNNPATHPTPDVLPPSPPSVLPTSLPVPTSLDPLESSVENEVDAFLAAGPEPAAPHPDTLYQPLNVSDWSVRYRHNGWANIRRRVHEAMIRTKQTWTRANAFAACGQATWIERSQVDQHVHRIRCAGCHDRLCTPCAWIRSMRLREGVMKHLKNKKPLFITLTLQGTGESLSELVDRLFRSFRYLRDHPVWEAVTGGVAFLEIKYSERGRRWHPHLHIMAEGRYTPARDLSAAWRSITKDSYIVDIQRVGDIGRVGTYVTKYASKPLNPTFAGDPKLLDEAVVALHRRRLCTTFGTWYGVSMLDDETEWVDEGDMCGAGTWYRYATLSQIMQEAWDGSSAAWGIIAACGARGEALRSMVSNDTS